MSREATGPAPAPTAADDDPQEAYARTRTFSEPSAMATFALRSFLARLHTLRLDLDELSQLLANARVQQQQGNQQRESADGAAAAESAALAAQARLADVEQALQSVHAAAASCDPAATLVSGRAAGLQAQMQVLSECAELAQEAQHLRSTIHGALALPPATGSAGAMPGPTAQAEVGSVASSAAASSLPAASAADVASAAADALSASTVDPLISSLVTRALGGRFAAAASSAIAASVTHDVHALLKRLEHCPFTVLAAELAAHGYHTLHDLADISPHAARILISSILTSMDAGDGAAADAAARTAAPAVADGAVHAPFPAHHPANGPKAPSLVPLASSGASATASATAGQPPPWFVESGSGSRSILLHAPLVSPIDRGVVVPDVMAVLGRGKFGDVYRCSVGHSTFALKMVKVGATADAFQATMRVVEEAKHLMTLRHENILEYRDVFGHHSATQNFVCIVMELCDGGPLSDIVFDTGLTLGGLVDVCRQLASALAYAHGHGVVHCDVKLENVLVRRCRGARDLIKLGDWGLARREAYTPASTAPVVGDAAATAPTRGRHAAANVVEVLDEEEVPTSGRSSRPTPTNHPHDATTTTTTDDDTSSLLVQPQTTSTMTLGVASTTFATEMVAKAGFSPSTDSDLALMDVEKRLAAQQGDLATSSSSVVRGTICYLPPEAFEEGQHLRRLGSRWAADMWALGCLVWEAATAENLPMGPPEAVMGRMALTSQENWQRFGAELMRQFSAALEQAGKRGGRNPEVSRQDMVEVQRALTALLLAVWAIPPLSRPAAADVAAHPAWRPEVYKFKLPPKAGNGTDEKGERAGEGEDGVGE